MQSIELKEVNDGGSMRSEHSKYYADGKRVTREKFNEIKQSAVRLECLSNSQTNGVWTFYSFARFN